MATSPTSKPVYRPTPPSSPPSPPRDWTTRRATIVGAILTVVGIGVAIWLAQPKYVPSTIFQPKNGDKPQVIADLTSESQTCDAAIRSLLLAFANDVDRKDVASPGDAMAKTKALVETDMALVPVPCQKLIDPRSVASDGNLTVAVRSLRYDDDKLKAALTIQNKGVEPIALAFEAGAGDRNVGFTDDRSSAGYNGYEVRGIANCLYPYCDKWQDSATRIGPGAVAMVTVEADKGYEYYSTTPHAASLALTLMSLKPDGKTETLSFGFHDVPFDK